MIGHSLNGKELMPFNEDQQRTLLTNLARDKAENLRNEIARLMAEAKTTPRPDLSEEDRAFGEYAQQRAMESAQRMVTNLEHALKLAEEMARENASGNEGDESIAEGDEDPESESNLN